MDAWGNFPNFEIEDEVGLADPNDIMAELNAIGMGHAAEPGPLDDLDDVEEEEEEEEEEEDEEIEDEEEEDLEEPEEIPQLEWAEDPMEIDMDGTEPAVESDIELYPVLTGPPDDPYDYKNSKAHLKRTIKAQGKKIKKLEKQHQQDFEDKIKWTEERQLMKEKIRVSEKACKDVKKLSQMALMHVHRGIKDCSQKKGNLQVPVEISRDLLEIVDLVGELHMDRGNSS